MCKFEIFEMKKKFINFVILEVFIGFILIWLLKGCIFVWIIMVIIYSIYMVYIEWKYEIIWFMCLRVKWIFLYIFVYCKYDLVLFIGGIYGVFLLWLNLNFNIKICFLYNNEVNINCFFFKYIY